jgi:hypothetical protein
MLVVTHHHHDLRAIDGHRPSGRKPSLTTLLARIPRRHKRFATGGHLEGTELTGRKAGPTRGQFSTSPITNFQVCDGRPGRGAGFRFER